MANEFKQCPNGHYYQGLACPYCKTSNNAGNNTSLKTEVFVGNSNNGYNQTPTESFRTGDGIKTTITDEPFTVIDNSGSDYESSNGTVSTNRTVFGETEFEEQTPDGEKQKIKTTPRTTRKLVGWLVTYSFDAMGVDYKLYEGRNIIGRDMDCNITINDGMISGKHATLLFRNGQYALKDELSSHGTFINGGNIGFEIRLLQDGDIIRMGKTTFMIRFSLFKQNT